MTPIDADSELGVALAHERGGATPDAVLSVTDLTKSFGGVMAVDHVSLDLMPGRVTGLIGANGAGKSTFINLVAGALRCDSGGIAMLSSDVTRWSASRRSRHGLARTFQHPRLVPNLNCIENVMLGAAPVSRGGAQGVRPRHFGRREQHLRDSAAAALEMVGFPPSRWLYRPKEVSPQEWLWLEIARGVVREPRVLMLDEPSTGFMRAETDRFIELLGHLTNQRGMAALLVSHDVSLAMRVSDIIAVLDHGVRIALASPSALINDMKVVEAYLGQRGRVAAARVLGMEHDIV